mgnify:CR=1 FL=1
MWEKKQVMWVLLPALMFLPGGPTRAEIRDADLNTTRSVVQAEWLRLKLEVMGLRLSYPAYRIDLKLSENNAIVFSFLASGGMANHLSEIGPTETKQMLAYHAQGIRDQVNELIKNEFPLLWTTFDVEEDFGGSFLVPAEDWDAPPRELAHWRKDRFTWIP